MLAVRAKANEIEIELTAPLRAGDGEFPADYILQQWWYTPSGDCGCAKRNLENLAVNSVTLSPDRRKAFLEMDGMKLGHVLYLSLTAPMLSESGFQLWSNETWHALITIPKERARSQSHTPGQSA